MKTVAVLFSVPGFAASDYLRERSDWLLCPGGMHRDSNALARSNNRVILKDLASIDPEGLDHSVERFGHWGVGWVEEIIVRPGTACAKSAEEWEAALAEYGIASNEDYSEEEQREANEVWANCYREKQRIEYIRKHRYQFDFDSFADLMGCVRGKYFAGYASELIA